MLPNQSCKFGTQRAMSVPAVANIIYLGLNAMQLNGPVYLSSFDVLILCPMSASQI